MSVVIEKFDETNPFSIAKLNNNLSAIVAVINTVMGDTQLQFGTTPSGNPTSLPITGGTLLGQLTVPSLLVGPSVGPKYEPITTNDSATEIVAGIVRRAANVAQLSQAISATPSQAEVQALTDAFDALLAALVASEVMSP